MLPVSTTDIIDFKGYRLRVPTIRSKSASSRDLLAEAVVTKNNSELVAALLTDTLSDDDRTFLTGVQTVMDANGECSATDWPRVYSIARATPAGARIIADRIYSGNMSRLHIIRHHLVIDGKRSPLSEADVDAIPPEDAAEIAEQIEALMYPSADEAKNSDAP